MLLALSGTATAQDPQADLAEAEARAAATESEVAEFKAELRPAQSRLEAAKKHAAPTQSELKQAATRVAAIEGSLRRKHVHAVASVSRVEEERRNAANDYDREISSGIGIAIAALITAAIALAWGWFRASAAVAYLARIELGQAIGISVSSGFVAVLIGAVIGSTDGVAGAIGIAILILGLVIPIALLLARHSAEVQRRRARPFLRRERLPAWAARTIAGLFALLVVIGLGSAIFAGEARSGAITMTVRKQAEDAHPSNQVLIAAEQTVATLRRRAAPLFASVHQQEAGLRSAKRRVGNAKAHLADAESDARRFTRRLAIVERHETREREREEREAQRQVEEEQREAEEAEEESSEFADCDPNYEGECLTPGIGDYDCAGGSGNGPNYVYSPVRVVGVDIYGLDANNNGIGCEDE